MCALCSVLHAVAAPRAVCRTLVWPVAVLLFTVLLFLLAFCVLFRHARGCTAVPAFKFAVYSPPPSRRGVALQECRWHFRLPAQAARPREGEGAISVTAANHAANSTQYRATVTVAHHQN